MRVSPLLVALLSLALATACDGDGEGGRSLLDRALAAMTRPGQVLYLEASTEHGASIGSDGLITLDPPSRRQVRMWLDLEGERARFESEREGQERGASLIVGGMVYPGKPGTYEVNGTLELTAGPVEEFPLGAFDALSFPWDQDAGWQAAGEAKVNGQGALLLQANISLGCPLDVGCPETGDITAVSTVYLEKNSLLPLRSTVRWVTQWRGEFDFTDTTVTHSSFIPTAELPEDFFSPESLPEP
ncbi:MAG: hypothetical protein Q8P22_13920 [Chloroflexota bacterium]|nr:hypothetical protein [Chloroflexota bacterium]